MKNVRIAMLGSGFVADFYLQGLANVNGQEVAVNYSRSKPRGAAFAKKWDIAETSSDLDAVIARSDIDLYIIALPNEIHLPVSLKLSKAKRNQACTKPLARNGREARAMFDAARKSGAIHGYAETEVFAPACVKARGIIESGGLGRVLWVRSRESHGGPHSPHFWDITNTGGGAMADLGCHTIEMARYAFGKEDKIVEVMAWGATLVHRKKTRGEDAENENGEGDEEQHGQDASHRGGHGVLEDLTEERMAEPVDLGDVWRQMFCRVAGLFSLRGHDWRGAKQ